MIKRLVVLIITVSVLLSGCSAYHKKIADKNRPGKHISYYDTLTALYGSGKMDTLNALGIGANDVKFVDENNNLIDTGLKQNYADIDLDVVLYYADSKLEKVYNMQRYRYPEEMDKAIADVMQIAAQLEKDLGKPHGVDTWNDWLEEEYQVEMDQKTPAYKSAEQIKAFLDGGMGGAIMSWDMTAVACGAVKKQGQRFESFTHYILLDISRIGDLIDLKILY